MTLICANRLVDSPHALIGSLKQLKKQLAVEQQNAADAGFAVLLISCNNHVFQHGNRYVVTQVTTVNNGSEHRISNRGSE
ncbi:hypothetical protein D3C75_543600 [compost metagenome]